jgi:hypothetical protein
MAGFIGTHRIAVVSKGHTVNIVQDIPEISTLPSHMDYLRYRVCSQHRHLLPHTKMIQHALKITPMKVSMINCMIITNAKERAKRELCNWDCVTAPWYRDSPLRIE